MPAHSLHRRVHEGPIPVGVAYADVGGEETGVNDEGRGDGERVDEGHGDESSLFVSFEERERKVRFARGEEERM